MKRSTLCISAIGLAALVSACFPDVGNNTPKPNVVVMEFNPPSVVPLPNDLAIDPTTGFIVVPTGLNDTPTQVEFNKAYLGTLDGFPMESTASTTTSGDLAVATLPTGVLVLDITNSAAPFPVATTPSYVAGSDVLNIVPAVTVTASTTTGVPFPTNAWTRGHQYAVVVKGGSQAGAVTGSTGQQVIGSSAWALVSGTTPLCAFPDGGPGGPGSGCLPTTDLICQAAGVTGSACAADAAQLQEIQSGYAPLLNALAGAPFNIPRSDVAILWTFRITSQAEATFDLPNAILPFPNDALRTGPGGTVSFPLPPGQPTFDQIFGGLNTLDGFSTTATIFTAVDFNIPNNGVSALMQGLIDPSTLTPQLAWGFQKAPGVSPTDQGDPQVSICVTDVPPGCPFVSATLLDGGVKPEALGIVPLTPLNEHTTYLAYLTNSIKDTNGKPIIPTALFGLIRLVQPLAISGKSQVTQLTDAQATQLLPLQQGLAPLFAGLSAAGIPRSKIVLAWGFQTITTVSALQQLTKVPFAGFPGNALWWQNVTSFVLAGLPPSVPTSSIGAIFAGEIVDPFALTGPGGTFNPDGGIVPVAIPFIMTVPGGGVPVGGFPITMFGHGLTGNKTNAYAIANALAQAGQVMIAIDEVWHGERGTCTGFGAYVASATGVAAFVGQDNLACSNPATMSCNSAGRCQLTSRVSPPLAPCNKASPIADQTCFNVGQNECASDNLCEGGDFAASFSPAPTVSIPVSGWNLINLANPFASRDSLRQQVIDNTQFARVASGSFIQPDGGVPVALNAGALSYSGQSLGGILGTLYSSVAFNVHNAGLNVPGQDVVDIIFSSPSFTPVLHGFQAELAGVGIATDSPTYDTVTNIYRWILDPADPANAVYFTLHPTGTPAVVGGPSIPANRRTFVQWILDDQVIPNPETRELVHSALHDPALDAAKIAAVSTDGGTSFWAYQFNGSSTPFSFDEAAIPLCSRHGFLLRPASSSATCDPTAAPTDAGVALTTEAQAQLVGFIAGFPPFP
jgi:hypothetical protein